MAEVHLADDFYTSIERERRCKKASVRTPVPKGGGPCVLESWSEMYGYENTTYDATPPHRAVRAPATPAARHVCAPGERIVTRRAPTDTQHHT